MTDETVKLGDEVTTGIRTEAISENDAQGFAVRWIEWDSHFRQTALQLDDLITGVNGESLTPLLVSPKASTGIGQYAEKNYWKEKGFGHGQTVCLQLVRAAEKLEISGQLHANYFYSDAGGNSCLGPGGPDKGARDNFEYTWSSWYEKFIETLTRGLNYAWIQHFDTRREYTEFLNNKERIDFLRRVYPGPFAEACGADWLRGLQCLQGKKVDITGPDLEYREIGEKRVQIAKLAASQAWAGFLSDLRDEMIKPYPARSIYSAKEVAGRVVELPRITYKDIVNSLKKAYAAIGSPEDGYYFVVLETTEIKRFYETVYRYKNQINPRMKDQYRYVGIIQDDPRLLVINGQSVMGLTVKPLGILAGEDECFIDLRGETTRFAGEETLVSVNTIQLLEQAGPDEVIKAMITAIKLGDYASWKNLFAGWKTVQLPTGVFGVNPLPQWQDSVLMPHWEFSRRLIMGEVFDARAAKVDRVRRIIQKNSQYSIPDVDQVTVFVDHFGLFDGEYRSFNNAKVNRIWTLQRLGEGPWKIASIQHL